nr:hypothetical protein [Micromonospora sp. DSM 115978]
MTWPPNRGRFPTDPPGPAPRRPHTPLRPLWLCRCCAAPWPCGDVRLTLLREYGGRRPELRIFLATCMHEAICDLLKLNHDAAPTAPELWARFLAWSIRSPDDE